MLQKLVEVVELKKEEKHSLKRMFNWMSWISNNCIDQWKIVFYNFSLFFSFIVRNFDTYQLQIRLLGLTQILC